MLHYRFCLFVGLLLIATNSLTAHRLNDTFLRLEVGGSGGDIEIEVPKSVLQGEDDKTEEQRLLTYFQSGLQLNSGDCSIREFELNSDGESSSHLKAKSDFHCASVQNKLKISYPLFFDQDPTHRAYLYVVQDGTIRSATFSPTQQSVEINLQEYSFLAETYHFILEGIWHIWIGADHLLFLAILLIPCLVPARQTLSLTPAQMIWRVAQVVTLFTVSHSVTLILAALGLLSLPAEIVEPIIAFSILVAAVNNIRPFLPGSERTIAFFFGLVHGLGFAGVLSEIGAKKGSLLAALIGFNVGVEIGQLVVVFLLFPILLLLRNQIPYERIVLRGGSAFLGLIGALWVVERVGNFSFMPF